MNDAYNEYVWQTIIGEESISNCIYFLLKPDYRLQWMIIDKLASLYL